MSIEYVRKTLLEVTGMFFKGATVVWTEQNNTKPRLPYITLKLGSVQKTTFPIVDEYDNRYYPCKTTLEVNLYTMGKLVTEGKSVVEIYENTATADMLDFVKFIESDEIVDYLAGKGIDLMLIPPVRDLTELQNDRSYRYRSMTEMTVSWSEEADGPYGIGGMTTVPNSSGGGTEEMVNAEYDAIEEIEMNVKTEGGNE